ncbi:hypothetical protein [Cupriavidus sp. PET2-C1]
MYTQIVPATDWFFVHSHVLANSPPTVWHLAAWGLTAEGQAVGLVGAEQGKDGVAPKLVSVPPVPGAYLHRDQLTEVEREQLRKR